FSAPAAPDYFTRTWQVEQGLPQNKVTAVVQTRDGYLWVGTYNGLARFDGIRFTVYDDNNTPELRSRRITSLFESGDGTLWIGTESGDVSQFKDGRFAAVPLHASWHDGKIYAITADDAGDVWLLNESGELARARDGKVLSPPSSNVTNYISLARGVDGTIWVEREGAVSALRNERLTDELSTNGYVQGFCAARGGGFWVANNGNVRKWKDGEFVGDFGAAPWGLSIVPNFKETAFGALAAGTPADGLWLLFPGQTNTPALHFNHTNGLPSDWVISLWEDREKNLWCGTGGGLVLIRPNNLETISPPDKWKSCPVLSVQPAPDGALWVGTEGAGVYCRQNGGWTNFDWAQGIRNSYVWSLAADAAGKIWAGTWGGGLFVQKDGGFDFAPGMGNFLPPMPALLSLGDELWIGTTTAGALRYQNGKLERFDKIAGEPFGDVRAIAQDKAGALWFGTAGGGLVRRENGNFRRFKKSDGLSSDFIECLHVAEDGAVWIGTFGGGLNRFKDGRFSVINLQQGLPNGVIGHIESDGRGFFWMSSYEGILRAREQDLNRCADRELAEVPFVIYGINDGLPTLECSEGLQSAGAKTPDGRLWFPTAKGLVVVDPAGVKLNRVPPPVRIEEMRVDDKTFADGSAAGPLKIPPGRHRIEFVYTGLSFVAPEKVRFKCRLDNFEADWANVGTKRVATYNYIPPGKYSFEVTACNNDGVWNEDSAGLAFEVLPHFWQTTWFHVLGGVATALAAGGVVWFDTRRRMRRRLEHAERQRDIERERSRIARDIHDDLGAQLTRITMMSESARSEVTDPERAAAGLDKIYHTAREVTRTMDEIVWAVNPSHDRLDSLANYLSRFAYEYLSETEIRCRLEMPLQLPALPVPADIRHNLFLALKEALHNIVKHSAATEMRIELKQESSGLILIVADNGRGFDSSGLPDRAPPRPGRIGRGNGLTNMKRRLAEIGGGCEIASEPGKGATVKFTVPLRA
ncbi:MAG TPA: two-component regulator propeller domain-containing protein, partial [Candidatus Acidoferrum sp.]|nr:two-component regulator propeller domain-containing protein [Candidatus Acidoferrum sp.]